MVNTPIVPSKFLQLKFLSISLSGQCYDIFSLVSFLYASPSLEIFIISVSNCSFPQRHNKPCVMVNRNLIYPLGIPRGRGAGINFCRPLRS